MTAVAIIPVRLESERLARKPLVDIQGKPLLKRVWECVIAADCFEEVAIATDSDEIRALAQGWGAEVKMTATGLTCGTERVAAVAKEFQTRRFVNIQADMPFLDPQLLRRFQSGWEERDSPLFTPICRIENVTDLLNPNVVKVARASSGKAIYFSRQPIPFLRGVDPQHWLLREPYWAHIGIYGYERSQLEIFRRLPESILEKAERLEQLRFLEAGCFFDTFESPVAPQTIDCVDDLRNTDAIAS